MEKNDDFVNDFLNGKLDYVSFMKCFNHLTLEEKTSFHLKITNLTKEYLKLEEFHKCEENGHSFGVWKTRKITSWNGLENGMSTENQYYTEYYRVCKNCDFEEKTSKQPKEYYNQQIEKEINNHKEAIKKLEKKLKK